MMPRRISRVPPRSVKEGACRHHVRQRLGEQVIRIVETRLDRDEPARHLRQLALERGADVFHQRGFGVRALALVEQHRRSDADMRCSAARWPTKRPISTACC